MTEKKRTPRGFREFAVISPAKGKHVLIRESSLAGHGPHVWVFVSHNESEDSPHDVSVHLSLSEAKELVKSIQSFIDEAEAGELAEDSGA